MLGSPIIGIEESNAPKVVLFPELLPACDIVVKLGKVSAVSLVNRKSVEHVLRASSFLKKNVDRCSCVFIRFVQGLKVVLRMLVQRQGIRGGWRVSHTVIGISTLKVHVIHRSSGGFGVMRSFAAL